MNRDPKKYSLNHLGSQEFKLFLRQQFIIYGSELDSLSALPRQGLTSTLFTGDASSIGAEIFLIDDAIDTAIARTSMTCIEIGRCIVESWENRLF